MSMPIFLQYSGKGINEGVGKGPLVGLKLGHKTLTPSNIGFELQFSSFQSSGGTGSGSSGREGSTPQVNQIVVTKATDSSSANLMRACATGSSRSQGFAVLKIDLLGTSPKGGTYPFGTIELTNATVVSYTRGPVARGNLGHPSHGSTLAINELEEIKFTFQKITWTWQNGGKSSSDDWQSQA
jgi:type VI secretion system secreted protein Hcp